MEKIAAFFLFLFQVFVELLKAKCPKCGKKIWVNAVPDPYDLSWAFELDQWMECGNCGYFGTY